MSRVGCPIKHGGRSGRSGRKSRSGRVGMAGSAGVAGAAAHWGCGCPACQFTMVLNPPSIKWQLLINDQKSDLKLMYLKKF
jgi:hypothetical protein